MNANPQSSEVPLTTDAPLSPAPTPLHARTIERADSAISTTGPSSLYGARLWRLGLFLTRVIPGFISRKTARFAASLYARARRARRETVTRNLLPLVNGDRPSAEAMTDRLFCQFSQKLVDLLRFEAGLSVNHLFKELTGWEHFLAAQKSGRGVLVVTPHLGNWEFGGPLLTGRGYPLVVITLTEPGAGFTELRKASRSRWGIETLVVANDPFAFVEIIRRLENGATVALLIDRPPAASAVTVELFGRSFRASVAAAELARASGCVVLPVYLPRTDSGYAAHILPQIDYDRASLRDREARRQFTQQIVRTFEPAISQHADQWYHFVPIWPDE